MPDSGLYVVGNTYEVAAVLVLHVEHLFDDLVGATIQELLDGHATGTVR